MIYLQSNNDNIPYHFDTACALYGAIDMGLDYKLKTLEDVCSGKYDMLIKNNLFVGSVEFMKEVFNRIGLTDIRVPRNSNRESKIITLKEAKEISKSEDIFIKPIEIKLFTGFVLDKMIHASISNISDDTEVLSYKPFESPIVSEWRCYIRNNEVEDSRNYSGDFKISPNYKYVESIINENTDFPRCYTIDVGILESGENVVVEFNDMWAIGNYGMDNYLYLRMLRERYFEIIKNN